MTRCPFGMQSGTRWSGVGADGAIVVNVDQDVPSRSGEIPSAVGRTRQKVPFVDHDVGILRPKVGTGWD